MYVVHVVYVLNAGIPTSQHLPTWTPTWTPTVGLHPQACFSYWSDLCSRSSLAIICLISLESDDNPDVRDGPKSHNASPSRAR